MSRAETYARVRSLRDAGLLHREIADALGLSRSYVADLLCDPTGEKNVVRRRRMYGECIECGSPTAYVTTGVQAKRCKQCALDYQKANAMWTRETIIQAIREFQDRYGRPPAATDWNVSMARALGHEWRVKRFYRDGCWPHYTSVMKFFPKWNAALEAAGVQAMTGGYPRVGDPTRRARATHYTEADYADGCPR